MKKLLLFFSVFASLSAWAQPQAEPRIYDTTTLRTYINAEIQPNGVKAITAYKMNRILNGLMNSWPGASGGGSITASQSILKTGSNLTLVNDASSPGNNKAYGTNSSGVKGWRDGIVSAANGLSVVNGNVELGGTITKSTNVLMSGSPKYLKFKSSASTLNMYILGNNGTTDSAYLRVKGGAPSSAEIWATNIDGNATVGVDPVLGAKPRVVMTAGSAIGQQNKIYTYPDSTIFDQDSGKYIVKNLQPTVDITTYKPTVTDSYGNVKRLDYWPIGGGSGNNIATAAQTATGNYNHNWAGYDATFDHLGYFQFIQDGGATANHDWSTRINPIWFYSYFRSVANGEFSTGGVHINGTDTATGENLEIQSDGRTKIYGWTNTTQTTVADISKDSINFHIGSTVANFEQKGSREIVAYKSDLQRVLATFYTDVLTVSTTETDFYSYTVPASLLESSGQSVEGTYFIDENGAVQDLKIYFAGNVILNVGIAAHTYADKVVANIIRTGTTTARCEVSYFSATGAIHDVVDLTGLDFTTTNILKITGEASTGIAVAKTGKIVFYPN